MIPFRQPALHARGSSAGRVMAPQRVGPAPQLGGVPFGGWLGLPLHYLRESLAASASWQAWTGTADAPAARSRIYPVSVEWESVALPLAVVDWAQGWTLDRLSTGSRHYPTGTGTLSVMFLSEINAAHTTQDAAWEFIARVSGVLRDVWRVAGEPGYLDVQSMTSRVGPVRSDEDEETARGAAHYSWLWDVTATIGVIE